MMKLGRVTSPTLTAAAVLLLMESSLQAAPTQAKAEELLNQVEGQERNRSPAVDRRAG